MKRTSGKTVPEDVLAEAAEPAFQRIQALLPGAPPLYKDLLEEMAEGLPFRIRQDAERPRRVPTRSVGTRWDGGFGE